MERPLNTSLPLSLAFATEANLTEGQLQFPAAEKRERMTGRREIQI